MILESITIIRKSRVPLPKSRIHSGRGCVGLCNRQRRCKRQQRHICKSIGIPYCRPDSVIWMSPTLPASGMSVGHSPLAWSMGITCNKLGKNQTHSKRFVTRSRNGQGMPSDPSPLELTRPYPNNPINSAGPLRDCTLATAYTSSANCKPSTPKTKPQTPTSPLSLFPVRLPSCVR